MALSRKQGEHEWWRGLLLRAYAWLIAYRFREQLGPPLRLPLFYEAKLSLQQVQDKARSSGATSGVFFAFSIAILAALMASEELRNELECGWFIVRAWKVWLGIFLLNVGFPYWLIWQERFISALSSLEIKKGNECGRYFFLFLVLACSVLVPTMLPMHPRYVSEHEVLRRVFSLSGFFLIILSAFFLLLSLEFYDYAAGWRGRREFQFHLASIASHSMSFGLALALVGVSLLLCLLNFGIGRVVTCFSLVVVFALPEIERHLDSWQWPDLVRLASLVEVAALAKKYNRVQELTIQIFKLAQAEPRRAARKEKDTSLRCTLLAAYYCTWVAVRRNRPHKEELRTWRDLYTRALTSGVSFKGFWSFGKAKKLLRSNPARTQARRKLLRKMVEAMESLGQSPSDRTVLARWGTGFLRRVRRIFRHR